MNWVVNNLGLIWSLTLDHIALAVPPIILGFLISIPIGWVANRYHASRGVLLTISGLLYTVPSLPLFIALPAILGTGILDPVNVVVGLTIYAVALMVRSVADALAAVDSGVRQAATAMGYSGWQGFWQVEFPLAGPVLLAGLRVVSVSTVSLVSIGSVIGVSSLGYLFLNGLQRNIVAEVISGIVATLVIAIVFDLILVAVGRILLPWAKADPSARQTRRRTAERALTGTVTS
ncbi:ABC transporter permease [Subtercola boreus]|uniref:ABC transporter permease n=1 Tax=Subtercola boreus TaxID=120213 RepID=A0A3E0WBJ1_9MICO|nr:ABC transporter permease [Subtercola boreus]RFA21794.1 ABC transporter permease [Subtercola boreus]RFA21905.1 ABC transporter permease [Subtercola boreus]RFA27853.1 ABC transporter permease [Subtercola boreus]